MAISKTNTFYIILVLICTLNENKCDIDVLTQNYDALERDDVEQEQDDAIQKYTEPEHYTTADLGNNEYETRINDDVERATSSDDYSTTESSTIDDLKTEEDSRRNVAYDDSRNDDIAETTEYQNATLSNTDNNVYKQQDNGVNEDIYINKTNNDRNDTESKQTATKPTIETEDLAPRIAELGDELDIQGQRSPKTENSEQIAETQRAGFDAKPHPPPVLSRSSTLKSWLEDSWIRPPAGILVPLRAKALSRTLAVWKDLMVEGLNISDVVIVGFDSNGINWRSRHNLEPFSYGNKDKAVSEALSKLLLKYQGVNSDVGDATMKALASAAKLVPYDSALFLVTDKGAGDPQRLPLALRALVQKRLKVYTIWTDPNYPSIESETELYVLKNVSRHTEGDVLPYALQESEVEGPTNLASDTNDSEWDGIGTPQARRGRLHLRTDPDKYETLLIRRGSGEAISLGMPVENGVSELKIYIEGAVEHAVLYPPNEGSQIDLYNHTSIAAFSRASKSAGSNPRDVILAFPDARTENDMLTVIPASRLPPDNNMAGVWHLSMRCDKCDYRLRIEAVASIHFDVDQHKPDAVRFLITGPVSSVRESTLVDEYGTELAKLPYSYPPITRSPEDQEDSSITELMADLQLPPVRGTRVYAKIVGRDTKGDPFVRLAGPVSPSESRTARSIVFPDSKTDLEISEETNSRIYNSKLLYNDSNILPYNRAVSQVLSQRGSLLTAVQIGLSTRLYGAPGDSLQLHFEVTNYRDQSVAFRFGAVGEQRFLTGITPLRRVITPSQTENVIVDVTIPTTAQPGARDFITFTAYGVEQVSISSYVYVTNPGQITNDVWSPEVRYNYQGTCFGYTGEECSRNSWSATIIARDAVSGLLRLTSSPAGLVYDSNFISGSREEVVATYRATCCSPRVIVTAVDANGNADSYVLDVSSYIAPAGIAAIVLGVFLAIALIIFIGFLIYWCVRRRKESRELPSYASRSVS